ncbi:MAG: chromosome segregation protein [Gemmatales bacterium]|nr:MAG: chromosome segregation protein [Gemmatales bacterium]
MNRAGVLLGGLMFLLGFRLAGEEPQAVDLTRLPTAAKGTIDFRRDIEPILKRHCIRCHGPEKQKAGLRLDIGEEALKGGNSGPSIKPKDAAGSRLLHMVAGIDPEIRMPPTGRMLPREDVAKLRAWIEQGASWPKSSTNVVAAGPRSDHWAFQPIRRPAVPTVKRTHFLRNPIDAFVLRRLEEEGIEPAPRADRYTLLRRLHFDLLGLPPTPEEVEAFIRDQRPDAYERLVDRLLASPHYGERWARHWLDLARYADSDGFEKDRGRPFAWRYRHWVIDALNRDLPFDQFTIEQLAGDLLPNATTEQKVATGFHRNTLTNSEGGVDREQFRVEQVVDRVNTTAKVFLGITFGCAQCHDHKYDPFSQREYYQFFAFFNSDNEVNIVAPLPSEVEEYRRQQQAYQAKQAELQAAIDQYRQELGLKQRAWEESLSDKERASLPLALREALRLPDSKRSAKHRKIIEDYFARNDKTYSLLQAALADHQKRAPKPTMAQTLALGPKRKTHVLIRGDFLRPGVEVSAGTPGVLPPLMGDREPTRLDLARWLVSRNNPLTARVIANWTWHKFFGRGIVATLDDFGTRGEKPSHPDLLDWLASEFMRQGWSLKKLHKLIVTSATYRQSSRLRPELQTRDPYNALLARQRRMRLEAEVIRDAALAASGLLTRTIGGPSVRPPQPPGISELTYANSARWIEDKGPNRYRRGLYIWFQRTSPYPMLMTFDAPDSNVTCVRRETSNTPLQALTLLNDQVFVECAQAFGRRIAEELEGSTSDRIRQAVLIALGRPPTTDELELLVALHTELVHECQQSKEAAKLLGNWTPKNGKTAEAAAWVALARTIMNLDEFIVRE